MASSTPMKKNTAVKIVFPIYDADGDLVTGAAGLDSEYSLDGGSFSDCTNEATEIGSTGIYYLELVAGETNGDVVCIQTKTSTSGAKTTVLVFYTAAQTLDEMDAILDSILIDTGTTLDGKLDTIDGIVDSILEDTGTTIPGTLSTISGYVDKIDDATDGLTAIKAEVEGLGGAAMRGTDSAALASVCTETRLAELDAANIPADVDSVITTLTSGGDVYEWLVWVAQLLGNRCVIDTSTSRMTLYDDDGATPLFTWTLRDKNGSTIEVGDGVPTERIAYVP